MAWTNLFPARKYTKYISWDILITIACAFAISKAMVNSGVADSVATVSYTHLDVYKRQPVLNERMSASALLVAGASGANISRVVAVMAFF